MAKTLSILALEFTIFIPVMLMIELGYRLAKRRPGPSSTESSAAREMVTGTVQVLMGLILAFSFSDAAARLDLHRRSVLNEANAIDTAWERIDLMPDAAQMPLRELFRQYLDTRIKAYVVLPDVSEYDNQVAHSNALREEIWALAVKSAPPEGSQSRFLIMPAINEMGDAAHVRTLALRTHLTSLAFGFMFGLILIGSLLVGASLAGRAGRSWVYRLIFAIVVSTAVHVILDMEYPRDGVVRTREADQFMIGLRKTMG